MFLSLYHNILLHQHRPINPAFGVRIRDCKTTFRRLSLTEALLLFIEVLLLFSDEEWNK